MPNPDFWGVIMSLLLSNGKNGYKRNEKDDKKI